MSMTVREKEHWKERIGKRIESTIARIVAERDPSYLETIETRAEELAQQRLGLDETVKRAEEIDATIERLKEERVEHLKRNASRLSGRSVSSIADRGEWVAKGIIDKRMESQQKLEKRRLMESDELGKLILALLDEQDAMLDTVWLATSPRQIRDLWESVSRLLNEQTTSLQEGVLAETE
ncbi:hypothetical protein [Rubripirellula reticaptiva]|uniref:Uncharacterized protein n=1 Tax=Rubripirellula reticaptiva TaxID=2528013 RepID=A0A5C6F496_9BACT|nr:hypothetical protein [Rubripirellula reticaptiva]TWU56015.1 hypothetical protein Poly59_23180 [Rubripirellula reticaptiva]